MHKTNKAIKAEETQNSATTKQMQGNVRSILITGMPGVGKTTLVKKICELLKEGEQSINYRGFYTEEVRENHGRGRRLGFDVVTLGVGGGLRGVLARETNATTKGPTIGKYSVFLNEFESIALKTLKCRDPQQELLIIDEIGKMELLSKTFKAAIQNELRDKVPLLATVPLKTFGASLALVDELKKSPSSKVYHVTVENRNDLVNKIIEDVQFHFGKQNKKTT